MQVDSSLSDWSATGSRVRQRYAIAPNPSPMDWMLQNPGDRTFTGEPFTANRTHWVGFVFQHSDSSIIGLGEKKVPFYDSITLFGWDLCSWSEVEF